jgi:hypothetical protein
VLDGAGFGRLLLLGSSGDPDGSSVEGVGDDTFRVVLWTGVEATSSDRVRRLRTVSSTLGLAGTRRVVTAEGLCGCGCCVIYCHSKVFMVQATRLCNLICGLGNTCGLFRGT